jgi:hypothetical protein
MRSTPTALKVILLLSSLGIYIEGEARQATYRLNVLEFSTRGRFDHSEVFEKMTNEPQGTKSFLLLLLEEGFLLNFRQDSPGLARKRRRSCNQMV